MFSPPLLLPHFSTLFIITSHLVSLEQVRALQCFICHTDDNESCEQKQCPNDQVYDRCMTLIYKNRKLSFFQEKKGILY